MLIRVVVVALGLTFTNIIPTTSYYRVKRAATEPVATAVEPTYLGEVLRYGSAASSDIEVYVAAADVRVVVGGLTLTAPGVSDWAAMAVTVDGTTATLFINGVQKDSGVITGTISASTVTVGDLSNDGHSAAPTIDEIRFSTVVRSDAWLQAQAAGATVTFQ
jgi:hypothetical protein